jgi:hypothetical protein
MTPHSEPTQSMRVERLLRGPGYLGCVALCAVVVAYNAEMIVRPMRYDSVFAPAPVPVVLPFWFGVPAAVTLGVWVWGFMVWNVDLMFGQPSAPLRTVWLWRACAMLSVLAFATGWSYGLRYQGRANIQIWLAASIAIGCASFVLLARVRRQPSYPLALAAHTLVWLWPVTFAAPWLGEG